MKLVFAACALVLAAGSRPAACAASVLSDLERAGNYQLSHAPRAGQSGSTTGWVLGSFYDSLSAFDRSGLDGEPFQAALVAIGNRNGWRLGPRMYHADDQCIGQMYLDLYDRFKDPRMLAAMKQRCDFILAHPKHGSLAFVGPGKNDQWAWCDSLFMAPAGWAHLSKITGNPAYLDYAVAHWWQTAAYLYDPAEHLYFRDSTYFRKREPNGRKVFWSRGNGWVMAGLARLLDLMPADQPDRPRFVRQFQEMAGRVRQLQQADGSWAASLLDPQSCRPSGEVSGTGFFSFALAWGVNRGVLDAAQFGPAARRAFAYVRSCEEPSGRMNHVQPIGAAPTDFPPEATEPYGVGAYILAGTQVLRLPR